MGLWLPTRFNSGARGEVSSVTHAPNMVNPKQKRYRF